MTLFDVPSHDVLFTHIFSNLRLIDIWNLRLVSRELHCLCWDYFINVCDTLSVTSQITHSSSLCVAAGINILSKCEKVRCLEVICGDQEVSTFFGKLLREVIRNENIVLKRVCFIGIDFTSITSELMDSFAIKCCKLREFKLRGILVREIPAEDIIAKLIKHCKQNLLKLSIMNLISPLIRPLSRETLPSLKCLSVSPKINISELGSYLLIFFEDYKLLPNKLRRLSRRAL